MRVEPLTPERWPDLERLLGPKGPYAGFEVARRTPTRPLMRRELAPQE